MIAYITGLLKHKQNDYAVIECLGIGYRINTSASTTQKLGNLEEIVTLHTYMYVREDILSLYGFLTVEELNMFELLISVSGVGPKAAISMLSAVPPFKFGLAIMSDDVQILTTAQGIGAKTAKRIILDLKDKIKKEQLECGMADILENCSVISQDKAVEAANALMVLGYSSQEANRAVSRVCSNGPDIADTPIEDIIKEALKYLVRG